MTLDLCHLFVTVCAYVYMCAYSVLPQQTSNEDLHVKLWACAVQCSAVSHLHASLRHTVNMHVCLDCDISCKHELMMTCWKESVQSALGTIQLAVPRHFHVHSNPLQIPFCY